MSATDFVVPLKAFDLATRVVEAVADGHIGGARATEVLRALGFPGLADDLSRRPGSVPVVCRCRDAGKP